MHPTTVDESASAETDFSSAVEAAKLRALYEFAYGLSHEINNPLANIATRAQTLLVDEKDPDRRRKLATIVQQAFRAHEMIADLMLFAHPPRMQPRETDLVQLTDTVIAEMQGQAREQSTRLIRTGDSGPLIATVDPTQIAVALKAIVQNALEAVQEGGCVEVSAECGVRNAELGPASIRTEYTVLSTGEDRRRFETPSATHIVDGPSSPIPYSLASVAFTPHSALRNPHFVLSITDTGPGIPPEVRPRIFDPFFSGREAGRGLGLGLSKAWRIVELHGGSIEVESEAGNGATFRVILPASREHPTSDH